MAEDSLKALEIPPPDPSSPQRVFLEVSLKEGLYPMMPHSMYCLPLWPGITLVLITKVGGHSFRVSIFWPMGGGVVLTYTALQHIDLVNKIKVFSHC